jgi:membrane protease YdiL (CAAX protease family)
LAGGIFLLFQVFVNGEEFGWRGYALPRLQARHSSLIATLIVGLVATIWHVPKYLTVGDPHILPFWFFALHTTMTAVFFTWVFNKTNGSLLLAILLHAGNNTGIVMLPVMPAAIGDTRPLIIAYVLQIVAAALVVALTGKNLGLKPARP